MGGKQAMNGINSVLPVLVQIRNQLSQLSLDDDFNIDVSETVVEEQVNTPQMPPLNTPNINPANLMPNDATINPMTGLTRTETALLSPDEKLYYQKQRGVV